MLEKLKQMNPGLKLHSVEEEAFLKYGKVLRGFPFEDIRDYMENVSKVPEVANVYHASIPEMESSSLYKKLSENFYGNMPIQIGYCNGNNSSLNGLEYHKGSEINYAITDLVLLLAHIWEIKNNQLNSENVVGFYLPVGTAIEVFSTTLHFAPCRVSDSGFKCLVVLPVGTNLALDEKPEIITEEDKLLFMRNKWLIAHPEAERLVKNGAYIGIRGKNLCLAT